MKTKIDTIREALNVSRAVHKAMCREDYVDMINEANDALSAANPQREDALPGSTLQSLSQGPDFHEPPVLKEAHGGKKRSGMMSSLVMMAAMMGGMDGLPGFKTIQRNPKPKNTDNSPDRAKGMRPFEVDGITIYAGTMRGAVKKARILLRVSDRSGNEAVQGNEHPH